MVISNCTCVFSGFRSVRSLSNGPARSKAHIELIWPGSLGPSMYNNFLATHSLEGKQCHYCSIPSCMFYHEDFGAVGVTVVNYGGVSNGSFTVVFQCWNY